MCELCRWRSTPPWTWLSLISTTTWWDVGANTTVTEFTCTDATQVRRERVFFLFLFPWFLNSFVVNSFYWFIHRRCLQRRDRRSIWTPETNHQQLCVVRPRDQYEGFLLGPRDSDSGCSEASGPVTSGPQRPIIRENTQKRCQFTSMADVDKLKLKKKSSYTTAATKEETLEQDRHQPWLNMVFFYSSYIRSHRILFLTILILWTWTTSNLS